jgi:hypothetical protein
MSTSDIKVCQKTSELFGQFGGLALPFIFAELGSISFRWPVQRDLDGQFVNFSARRSIRKSTSLDRPSGVRMNSSIVNRADPGATGLPVFQAGLWICTEV